MVKELHKGVKVLKEEIGMNLNQSFDKILNLFTFAEHLIKEFGLNSMKVCEAIILSDIDWFNITCLFTKMVRLIIQKKDQTTIDLGSNSLKASAITDKLLGSDHRLKKSHA